MPQPSPASALRRRAATPPVWRLGAGAPPSGSFVALVPGEEAPLLSLVLPATLRGAAREDVARRQAQDRLGAPGAALDIRPARLGAGDGWTRVAVADRAVVQRWRKALGTGAGRCKGLVPDYLALPAAPGLWSIDASDAVLRARLGPGDGFTAETALGMTMIEAALRESEAAQGAPRAVLLTGSARAAVIPLLHGVTIVSESGDLPAGLQPRVLEQGELSVDFARDPRADAEAVERQVRRLVWPVALMVAGALGWAGATALAARSDRAMAEAVRAETLAAVRRDVLPTGPILDLRVQVQRAIEARRDGATDAPEALAMLDLLRLAAPVLVAGQVEPRSVAYGPASDGLLVTVALDSFRALDTLNAALTEAGLAVTVERSGTDEGGVSAELMLREGER